MFRGDVKLEEKFYPSLKEQNDKAVKVLSEQLKGKTDEETLTNVLDWQNNNVNFWFEKEIFFIIFLAIILLTPIILATLMNFGKITADMVILLLVTVFPSLIVLTVTIIVLITKFYRKIPVKQIKYLFPIPFFPINMPVDLVIKHRYGICQDYAKLTACLLKQLFPNAKIFFVEVTRHVATGIFIGKQKYILDQCLPIKTIHGWWYKEKYSKLLAYIWKSKSLDRGTKKEVEIKVLNDKNWNLDSINITIPKNSNPKKLRDELSKRLKLNTKNGNKKTSKLVITWKNGELYYENNEIVNYSLVRWFKNKISDEGINLNQISAFEIGEPNEKDMEFEIEFFRF